MTRDILASILDRCPGTEAKDGTYSIAEEHHLTFYVGEPGRAMAIADVEKLQLLDGFIEMTTRETGTTVFVEYQSIAAVATKPPKDRSERKAGFGF